MSTSKPIKVPSMLGTIAAAIGVTPDEAAPAERVWPTTRAERQALLSKLCRDVQAAAKTNLDQLEAQIEALRIQMAKVQATRNAECARIESSCGAEEARLFSELKTSIEQDLAPIAAAWCEEPSRKLASQLAERLRAHVPTWQENAPGHQSGYAPLGWVVAEAFWAAVGGGAVGGGPAAERLIVAAVGGEPITSITRAIEDLEHSIRESTRPAPDPMMVGVRRLAV